MNRIVRRVERNEGDTPMTEADLEILEMYLDDALSDRELADVAMRIANEPVMAAELERLRGEREMRRQFYAAMEPTDAAVERLLGRVDESMRRRTWWQDQSKWTRWGAAAAACIAIGFTTGYLGRGTTQPAGPAMVQAPMQLAPPMTVASNTDEHGKINFVGRLAPAQVQLTDDRGQVIGVQRFDSVDKANEFVSDVRVWQENQQKLQAAGGPSNDGKF